MAKLKKSAKSKKAEPPEKSILDWFERPKVILSFFALVFVLMAFLYQPLVFEGKEPSGSDVVTGIGKTHQIKIWEAKTGHYPLWNPAMFGGMPVYHRFGPRVWSLDTLLNHLDFLGDWRLWFFLTGALGMFLLVKFLGMSAAVGMMASLAFILMPHFQALIIVGHFSKFRALMWMPYVLLSALLLLRKRNFLSALIFSLALAMQFRTQHYQIMFYTLVAVIFLGLPQLYRMLKEKQFPDAGKTVALAVMAGILMVIVVSQNLLSIKEYTPYSTRGGHAISLQETGETHQEKKGVGFDYATNWSYSVSEWWNLAVARFHGGTSAERYTGTAVPAWKNRELPIYWGSLPFTQSYEYLGVLIVFLALLAVVFQWSRTEVKSLTLLTAFALLLSLGKNFSVLYKPLFFYMPYFDKFRVPMMVLTLVMFTTVLLAAYGLSFLLKLDYRQKEELTKVYIVAAGLGGLLLIPLLFGGSFSLSHPGEIGRYGQEVVANLKKIRLEMLKNSALLSLLFLALGVFGIFSAQKSWIKKGYLPLIVGLLIGIDLFMIDARYVEGKFTDPKSAEQMHYRRTPIDNAIQQDQALFRVLPLDNVLQDTRWCYNYQSVGGYSPAKMQVLQELVENCLLIRSAGGMQINWNVVNMLNVRYLISNRKLPFPNLQLVASNTRPEQHAYSNPTALPRAWFVGKTRTLPDGVERLQFLNSAEFNPSSLAVLEKELSQQIEMPDSSRIRVQHEPEKVVLDVYTDMTSLLVLSEIYYPRGWRAVLDDREELEIFKTNHLLRSVVVPTGSHKIVFTFRPKSYYAGLRISFASLLAIYLLLLIFLYREYGGRLKTLLSRGK